jgi:hypothetical protein
MKVPKWLLAIWHGDAGKNWKPADGTGGRGEIAWNPDEDFFPPGTFTDASGEFTGCYDKGIPPVNVDIELTEEQLAKLRADLVEALKTRTPVVLPDPPAFSPRHVYGGKGTIHRTSTIDVQQDEAGNVVAVWFRCLNLPFTCSNVDETAMTLNPYKKIAIEEITYVDLPGEGSSQ